MTNVTEKAQTFFQLIESPQLLTTIVGGLVVAAVTGSIVWFSKFRKRHKEGKTSVLGVENLKEAFFKHETGVTPKEWDERQKGLVKQISAIYGLQ